ncbi:hypothetical protein TrCOL_g3729 [Triparma columacea]|uniref:Methyltransferase domain-containing protein n=1 Tax=Triparma columacea TaxID=722753 RepID=A0A9W7GQI9_9STRA|nr:hypothetical protein TrCOL_g3729 [Triparma columacea]
MVINVCVLRQLDNALAEDTAQPNTQPKTSHSSFHSSGYTLRENTNSFTASRDTNISPGEAYDVINHPQIRAAASPPPSSTLPPRALDVGCGAGVSTEFLWNMGFRDIDAIDWSGEAWRRFVVEGGRESECVRFTETDDESFVEALEESGLSSVGYDVIVYNFAVNERKARSMLKYLRASNPSSRLLAPVNTQPDYWQKQSYLLLDRSGSVTWSAADVGAWSVQFQPDVTQGTCSGYWCAPFNGFKKKVVARKV